MGRLKTLKTRDDAMQAVLAEAAAKLPGLAKGSGYTSLLEGLILEALIQVAEAKVSVRGVAGQAAVTQKALTPAVAKFKEWALKNKGAEFASAIDVSFDSTGLTSGIGGVEVRRHYYGSSCYILSTHSLPVLAFPCQCLSVHR